MPAPDLEELKEEIRQSILRGRSRDAEALVLRAVEEGMPGEEILRQVMVPAMRSVGEIYRTNEADIPRILSAARSMQKGLQVLEPHMESRGSSHIGTVILGTIEGDLHEVGKNLVAIMLRCEGLEVVDLGVDVSGKQFLKAIRETPRASVVCISSLLTTSLGQMRKVVEAIRRADPDRSLYIMVGGGSVTEKLAREMGADAYTEDAVSAAEAARAHVLGRES